MPAGCRVVCARLLALWIGLAGICSQSRAQPPELTESSRFDGNVPVEPRPRSTGELPLPASLPRHESLPENFAQPSGPVPDSRPDNSGASRPDAPQSGENVWEVRVVGNRQVSLQRIGREVRTRADRPFDLETVEEDVRRLYQTRLFMDVTTSYRQTADGLVVFFNVVERPTLLYVKYVGNSKVKKRTLEKKSEIKPGDAIDPTFVEEARVRLEEFYLSKGYSKASVKIIEGDKPGDRGAVFLINEGQRQKVLRVKFVGHTIVSAGRLKTQIESKPPLLWLFKGDVDRQKIDDDVQRLTAYYRSLGFFSAKIGRELEFNEDQNWLTLTFVVNEGQRFKVRDVAFIGNQKFESDQLAGKLQLAGGQFFDQAKLTRDLDQLKDTYGSIGHIFANIEPQTRFLEEPGQVDLVYSINEGYVYRIGRVDVTIKGENPHTRRNTVLNPITVRPGDIADTRQLRKSETRLKATQIFMNDPIQGNVPTIVLKEPEQKDTGIAKRPQPDQPTIRGQSPQFAGQMPLGRTGPADAPRLAQNRPVNNGRHSTRTNVYRGQEPPSRNFDPGPPPTFNSGDVRPAPQNAPTFGGESIDPPPNPQAVDGFDSAGELFPEGGPIFEEPSQIIDIVPTVVETQTGRIMIGAAVNSNAGVFATIVLDEQNFDWRRFPTSWEDIRNATAFRGGGQQLRIEAVPGDQISRYLFSFREPYLFDSLINFGISGYYFTRQYRDWDEERLGGRFSLGYQFPANPDLSTAIALRAENVEITRPSFPTPPEVERVLGDNGLYSVRWDITYDTRDSTFLPTEGHRLSFAFEQAFGDFDFPKFTVEARKHFTLRERADGSGRHVLSVGSEAGFLGNDAPVFENFFAGGFATLRGFFFRSASPRTFDALVGGRFQWLNSVEYLFPITADDALRGVVFCDFGTVERDIELHGENYRVSPGAGLRITIPALGPAPIALDVAAPIAHADGDRIQNFSFFVGFTR